LEDLLKQLLAGQSQLIEKISNLENDMSGLKQSLARIEQDQGAKISALFDARELQIDSNKRMNDTLNRIESTVDKIALRTVYNEAQIRQAK